MSHYQHPTLADRRLIFQLLSAKVSAADIAAKLGRHVSTVHREIKPNHLYDEDQLYRGCFLTVAYDKAPSPAAALGQASPRARIARACR